MGRWPCGQEKRPSLVRPDGAEAGGRFRHSYNVAARREVQYSVYGNATQTVTATVELGFSRNSRVLHSTDRVAAPSDPVPECCPGPPPLGRTRHCGPLVIHTDAMDWHFCPICMGQGRYLEPSAWGYHWLMCDTCIGTGAVVDTETMPLAA
jgi:hypothetical protein